MVSKGTAVPGSVKLSSPVSLKRVFTFAVLFLALEIAGTLAQRRFGSLGFLVVSICGGLVSSASTTATAAALSAAGKIDPATAGLATVLTSISSALVNLPVSPFAKRVSAMYSECCVWPHCLWRWSALPRSFSSVEFPFNVKRHCLKEFVRVRNSEPLTCILILSAFMAFSNLGAEDGTDLASLKQLANEIVAAAPPAGTGDASAYAAASQKLRDSKALARMSGDFIVWGGHAQGQALDPEEHSLTKFDPFIWRGEYLAEFMFSGAHSIERGEKFTVLAMDCEFRNGMDPGDYPYPFWHSANKWRSYQLTRQILFLFEKDKLVAAYRSPAEDPTRPTVARTFDGNWHWSSKEHADEPHVSLYANQFSKGNPHVAELDDRL